jgi:general secretion pathway protein K
LDLTSGRPTALTEPWATPLAESRLSTFLAVDKANADDGPEAFLSGNITDAQARYNLMNLVIQGKVVPLELQTLERLCQTLGVDTGVAARIANGLRDATGAAGTEGAAAPLLPKTVSQLAWLGIDAASLQALRPYVVLLPAATAVNVNTASKEVLIAAIKGLDAASAERLVQIRQRAPFRDMGAFGTEVPTLLPLSGNLDVRSSFFEVRGRLRLADHVLTERSLVQRLPNGQSNVLLRERIASLEQVGE